MRPDPRRKPGRTVRVMRAVAAGFILAVGLTWLVHSAVEWIATEAAEEEIVIARMVAHQLDQTVRAGKIFLTGAALRVEGAEDLHAGAARALSDLAPRLVLEPQFLALTFLDAQGRVVRSSDGRGQGGDGGRPPEFFGGVARGHEFHIGYGTRHDGETELVIAHRLGDEAGEFRGVAGLTIDLARLRQSLDATVSLTDRKILAVRPDGVALFRLPDNGATAAGRDVTGRPYFRALLAGAVFGGYDAVSMFDGERRVGGYALSPDRDLLVMSARARDDVLRAELLGKGRTALILAALLALGAAGAAYAAAELRHRRRLLDERDELLRSLDVAEAGIAISDADTQALRFVNPAFERMTGYTMADVVGANCRILQGPATDPATVARIRAALAKGEPVRVDILNYRKDGTTYWSDLSIAPIRGSDGALKGFVSAFLDVTDRVSMTAKLNEALGDARAADRAKAAFLARMSHELRTPLNAIIGFADTMRLRVMGPLSERYADYAGDIGDSGRHLLALVERILEMARLEADGRAFENATVDLADIARAAATLARPAIDGAAARIEIENTGMATARGDATALRQIAINLVTNAAHHGRKGGTIRIRTGKLADGGARLEVVDDGPGLAPDLLAKIGKPFLNRRADTADGEGVGLGLAISMELAKRMGGKLTLANAHPGVHATLDLPTTDAVRNVA